MFNLMQHLKFINIESNCIALIFSKKIGFQNRDNLFKAVEYNGEKNINFVIKYTWQVKLLNITISIHNND